MAGEALAIHARVTDVKMKTDALYPDAAGTVRIICAPVELEDARELIYEKGARDIALLPSAGDAPSKARGRAPGGAYDVEGVEIDCTATEDGYELQALVPAESLNIQPDADEALFDVIVNTADKAWAGYRVTPLFGLGNPSPDGTACVKMKVKP